MERFVQYQNLKMACVVTTNRVKLEDEKRQLCAQPTDGNTELLHLSEGND